MNNKNIFMGLTIVILLVIIAVLLFMYSLKYNKEEVVYTASNTNETNITPKNEEKDENTLKEMDINDKTITRLYSYIPAKNTNIILESAYQSKIITVDNLPNTYLLSWAFLNTEIEDSDKITENEDFYRFDAEILQKTVKEMYGKNLPNETFNVGAGSGCSYNEITNEYRNTYGGGSGQGCINVKKIEKAYSEKDNIYIEDKYIYVTNKVNIENGIEDYALYKSSDKTEIIKEFNSKELNPYASYSSLEDYVLNNYSSEMVSYKHTFKKAENGEYYWYSTEPIK